MKKVSKRLSLLLASLMIILSVMEPMVANAKVPYRTYTQNGYGEYVETQTAYTPSRTILKINNPVEGAEDIILDEPQDLKITEDGTMYIADTDNSRIVVCDLQGNLIKIIGEEVLEKPMGLFITDEYVYVADSAFESKKEGAIIIFDKEGNKVNQYNKPKSLLYGSAKFQPEKLVVDKGGIMYITCKGNTNGVVQITPTEGGTFLGYFGTNETEVSALTMFLNLVLTDEQRDSVIGNIPIGFSNIGVDSKGLIYTVTSAASASRPVRKLNIAGTNLFEATVYPLNATAVAVGQYDNLYVGTTDGYIYEYSSEGSCLFVYGGLDDNQYRVGLFNKISAIDVDKSDNIYVLDSKSNEIQVFVPTEFTSLIHESLVLYQKGLYTQSKEPLEKIIRMNGLFDYANDAMGKALEQEENYSEALEYYRLAKNKIGYSDSFWEIRNIWINENILISLLVIVGLVLLKKILAFADKKKGIFNPLRDATLGIRNNMTFKRLTFGPKYMRHPLDGPYAVKKEGMHSYLTTFILLAVFITINIINKYFCGFIFKGVRDGRYNIASDVLMVIFVLFFAASVTYLICTINDGEGRFREIFTGYVYSLSPYMIIQPIIFVLTMVLTYNEAFIIEFTNLFMIVWIIILIFLTIKEINNYSAKETFKVIGLTIFTAFVFILIAFVMYILAAQFVGFVTSIFGEVVYRIAN